MFTFTLFSLLPHTSRNRYPSRNFCLAATTTHNTTQVQVPYSLVVSVSTSRLACVTTRASYFDCVKLRLDHLLIFPLSMYVHLTVIADIVAVTRDSLKSLVRRSNMSSSLCSPEHPEVFRARSSQKLSRSQSSPLFP